MTRIKLYNVFSIKKICVCVFVLIAYSQRVGFVFRWMNN